MAVSRGREPSSALQRVTAGVNDKNGINKRIFLLSASDEAALRNQATDLQILLQNKKLDVSEEWLDSLACTLGDGKREHSYRAAVVSSSASQLRDSLGSCIKIHNALQRPTVGFIFTGQGAHWAGMGKELLDRYPAFYKSIGRIDAYMRRIGAPYSVIEEILRAGNASQLGHPLLSQPIVSALQIALVDLLAEWEIRPDAVAGHSSGEIAAGYAAGMLSMEDAITVAYYRGVTGGTLLEKGIKGAMVAVGLSLSEARLYVAALRTGRAAVACENGPTNVTISGDAAAIEELETFLQDKGIFTRRLAVEVAYHSHHIKVIADDYYQSIAHISPLTNGNGSANPGNQRVQFFSSVTGSEVSASELNPEYWVRNLVEQVRMVDAVKSLCYNTGTTNNVLSMQDNRHLLKPTVDTLIEIGPHAELAGPIKQILSLDRRLSRAHIEYSSVLIRGIDARSTALEVAASLLCRGYPGNLQEINHPDEAGDQKNLHSD
ncbi:acyl transferase/acyl hydrolase/lysophospholipase [Aspergillus unguis]